MSVKANIDAGKLLDAMACADGALEAGKALLAEKRAAEERAMSWLPRAAEAVLQAGLVGRDERAELERALGGHDTALEFLAKAAAHYGALHANVPPRLGSPEPGRPRDHGVPGSLSSSYVGARTTRLKESDLRFFEHLGITPTQDN